MSLPKKEIASREYHQVNKFDNNGTKPATHHRQESANKLICNANHCDATNSR
jgi:hypothetical protein